MQSIFPRLASYLKSNSFGLNFINFLVVEIFVKWCHAIFKARVDTQRAFQNHSGISKRISLNQYFPMICICKTFANGKFSYLKRRNVKIQFAGRRRSQSPNADWWRLDALTLFPRRRSSIDTSSILHGQTEEGSEAFKHGSSRKTFQTWVS